MKNFLQRQYLSCLLLLLIGISHPSAQTQERYSVSGVVLDAETGKPLPSANVFFANTMMGSVTDSTGRFLIRNVPVGTFELVVSRVGYEVAKREIQISGELVIDPAFKLRPIVLSAAEVEVTAPYPKKWKTHLEQFSDLLLSTTKNAAKAKILNSHVLEFHEEKDDQFVVTALEPLLIENWALGYKLNFVLVEFRASSQKLQYKGSIKFDELAPSSEKQAEEWRKNRLRTYQGSLRHFLAT
ncbi:MAG: carboxypeptidase-like regulatory domain-containing protein, partial [bacterium]